jgi:hypothetical protein
VNDIVVACLLALHILDMPCNSSNDVDDMLAELQAWIEVADAGAVNVATAATAAHDIDTALQPQQPSGHPVTSLWDTFEQLHLAPSAAAVPISGSSTAHFSPSPAAAASVVVVRSNPPQPVLLSVLRAQQTTTATSSSDSCFPLGKRVLPPSAPNVLSLCDMNYSIERNTVMVSRSFALLSVDEENIYDKAASEKPLSVFSGAQAVVFSRVVNLKVRNLKTLLNYFGTISGGSLNNNTQQGGCGSFRPSVSTTAEDTRPILPSSFRSVYVCLTGGDLDDMQELSDDNRNESRCRLLFVRNILKTRFEMLESTYPPLDEVQRNSASRIAAFLQRQDTAVQL